MILPTSTLPTLQAENARDTRCVVGSLPTLETTSQAYANGQRSVLRRLAGHTASARLYRLDSLDAAIQHYAELIVESLSIHSRVLPDGTEAYLYRVPSISEPDSISRDTHQAWYRVQGIATVEDYGQGRERLLSDIRTEHIPTHNMARQDRLSENDGELRRRYTGSPIPTDRPSRDMSRGTRDHVGLWNGEYTVKVETTFVDGTSVTTGERARSLETDPWSGTPTGETTYTQKTWRSIAMGDLVRGRRTPQVQAMLELRDDLPSARVKPAQISAIVASENRAMAASERRKDRLAKDLHIASVPRDKGTGITVPGTTSPVFKGGNGKRAKNRRAQGPRALRQVLAGIQTGHVQSRVSRP